MCVFDGTGMFVCTLQLLDQMPDASSSSITSFIAWFVFSISAVAAWVRDFGQYNYGIEGKLIVDSINTISSCIYISLCAALIYLQVLFLLF